MLQGKPQNHVTRALAQDVGTSNTYRSGLELRGNISPELLRSLKEAYPARCKKPKESEEDHQRYAGKVELIALLEAMTLQNDTPDEDDLSEAERAT